MTKTKKTETDELFASYARTAPLGDLRFYLRYAEKKLAEVEYPETTIAIIREMVGLERELATVVGTPALKKRVWSLIDRFKTSIPEWYGHAGVAGAWVDPIDSPEFYFRAQKSVLFITIEMTNKDGETVEHEERLEGPLSVEMIADEHQYASTKAEKLKYQKVGRRAVPLTRDEVDALIRTEGDAIDTPATVRARKVSAPKSIGLACPRCGGGLLPVAFVEHTFGCAQCKETWHLEPVRKAKTVSARPPRQAQTTREGLTEMRCACKVTQPIAEFVPSRSDCRTCRQEYRRQLATRKQAA